MTIVTSLGDPRPPVKPAAVAFVWCARLKYGVRQSLGLNEALILSEMLDAARGPFSVADIADGLRSSTRDIDGGTIYLALRRLKARGYVASHTVRMKARDGIDREVMRFEITGDGKGMIEKYARDARRVVEKTDAQPEKRDAPTRL
jgi:DNA-binding PadR family transcriptional regulator